MAGPALTIFLGLPKPAPHLSPYLASYLITDALPGVKVPAIAAMGLFHALGVIHAFLAFLHL
jgi:hypothetical protein